MPAEEIHISTFSTRGESQEDRIAHIQKQEELPSKYHQRSQSTNRLKWGKREISGETSTMEEERPGLTERNCRHHKGKPLDWGTTRVRTICQDPSGEGT